MLGEYSSRNTGCERESTDLRSTNRGERTGILLSSKRFVLLRDPPSNRSMSLIKSKQRVADHGEVFTPAWMVEAMLDLVKSETERIDSRFLEPACGSGNFLVRILQRKLAAVELKYGKNEFEKSHFALFALMCCYGIELLADNIAECRANMLEVFAEYLDLDETDDLCRAAAHVLAVNIVHGDAMTMKAHGGTPIVFAEWGYLGSGKFQRRDFSYEQMTGLGAWRKETDLFSDRPRTEIFDPIKKEYPPMRVVDLAQADTPVAPKAEP